MGDIVKSHGVKFDVLRKQHADGTEYWSARDLQGMLGYTEWRKFAGTVERARVAAQNTGESVTEHFVGADKTQKSNNQHGSIDLVVDDVHLSRYAAYLVAMNGDPRKPAIAAAQRYFAVKTRQAEQIESSISSLSYDDEERMLIAQVEGVRVRKAQQAQIAKLECKLAAQQPRVILAQQFLANRTFAKAVLLTDVYMMVCGFYEIKQDDFFQALRDRGVLRKQGRLRPTKRYVTNKAPAKIWFANPPAVDDGEAKADYTVTPVGVDGIIQIMIDLQVKPIKLSQSECNALITAAWGA